MEDRWKELARAFLRGVQTEFEFNHLREAIAFHRGAAPRDSVLGPWLTATGWHRTENKNNRMVWKRTENSIPCYVAPEHKSLKRNRL